MANDCMNTLWFCSMDKNLLHQLFDKFRSCFDTICEGKVADLLKKHGYSGAEADRRDYITGCDVLSAVTKRITIFRQRLFLLGRLTWTYCLS